jgi:photosystem II stability/assembly factor-like uncharacterized protein
MYSRLIQSALLLTPRARITWTITFAASLVLLTVYAFTRPSREIPPRLFSWDWWQQPLQVPQPSPVTREDLGSVYFVNERGWTAGRNGVILSTIDAGLTWRKQESHTDVAFESVFFAADALHGWAVGGEATILCTTDGGDHWIDCSPDRAHSSGAIPQAYRSVVFLDTQRGWVVGDFGRILATRDGGLNWELQSNSVRVDTHFFSVSFADERHGWAVGKGAILKWNGEKWEPVTTLNFPQPFNPAWNPFPVSMLDLNRVCMSGSDNIWIGTTFGYVFSSSNGGATWTSNEWPDKFPFWPQSFFFLSPKEGWAVGHEGMVARTLDGGLHWTLAENSGTTNHLMSVHFVDSTRGWTVGLYGTILTTSSGGLSWRTRLPIQHALCPPWYFVPASFLVFLLTLLLAHQQPHTDSLLNRQIRAGPVDLNEDLLGARGLVTTLDRLISNPGTAPPLAITVEGSWGTGKSTVMRMLASELKKRGARIVWFNAWHHQKEDSLLAFLLEAIKRQAVPSVFSLSGIFFRFDLLWVRVARSPIRFILAIAGLVASVNFRNLPAAWTSPNPRIKGLVDLVLPFSALGLFCAAFFRAFAASPERLIDSARSLLPLGDLRGRTDVRADFASELKDVVSALAERRLVIFLDDLDRCRPEQVLVVLEAINFITASADCFFVLGIDRSRVLDVVTRYYQENGAPANPESTTNPASPFLAEQYLRKIINLRTHVPAPTEDERTAFVGGLRSETGVSFASSLLRFASVVFITCVGAALLAGLFAFRGTLRDSSMPTNTDAFLENRSAQPHSTMIATENGGRSASMQNAAVVASSPSPPTVSNAKQSESSIPTAVDYQPELIPNSPSTLGAGIIFAMFLFSVLCVVRAFRKLRPRDIEDTPEFARALALAAPAIWRRARGNPREAQRIHNTLRLLAVSEQGRSSGDSSLHDPDWEPNLVGIAVFTAQFPPPPAWSWHPSEAHLARYDNACRVAHLNPATLDPEDEPSVV